MTIPKLSEFGTSDVDQSKLISIARHEMRHALAGIVFAEVIFSEMEGALKEEMAGSLKKVGVGKGMLSSIKELYYAPMAKLFEGSTTAQNSELHTPNKAGVRQGADRTSGLDPAGNLVLGGVGAGANYDIAAWKKWVLDEAEKLQKSAAREFGRPVDANAKGKIERRIDVLYDWIRVQFDRKLYVEGVSNENLARFKD